MTRSTTITALVTCLLASTGTALALPAPEVRLSDDIEVERVIDADASRLEVTPLYSASFGAPPPEDTLESFEHSYEYRREFGNTRFGAAVDLESRLGYHPMFGGHLSTANTARVFGRLFGRTVELVDIAARASAVGLGPATGAGGGAGLVINVRGRDVHNWYVGQREAGFRFFHQEPTISRTFLSRSQRFMVGPVPMRVTAALSGAAGIRMDGKLSGTHSMIEHEAAPFANLSVTASAEVDMLVASMGAEARLKIIEARFPITTDVAVVDGDIEWLHEVRAELEFMAGEVLLFVRLLRTRYERVIADWQGWVLSQRLLHDRG